ncbi:MAG TPA: S8 family serine peptidase [Bryobacteraceae bacterium]|nr:S8 family serine peptidase [Bryobacteraceae bacterium]
MNAIISWVFAGLFFISLAAGQIVPGRYIVELTGEPAATLPISGFKGNRRAAMQDRRAAVRAEQALVRTSLEDVAVVDSVDTVANALIVEAPGLTAGELAAMPGVAQVHPVRLYKLALDRAVQLQQVVDAWNQIGGMNNAGRGIKIGVIDTGIDNTHPGFQDTTLPAAAGFPKVNKATDIAYTNNKIIVARNYDGAAASSAKDVKGHGTSIAMVAAGVTNVSPQGPITGIAPKAYLGSYKVFPDSKEGAPSDQILRALEDAVADGMDVINLSLGSLPAESTRSDIFVRAIDRAAAAGAIVVVAAGNDGPDPNTIASPGTAASAITVGNAHTDRIFASAATLEGLPPYIAIPGSSSNSAAAVRAPALDVFQLDPTGLACAELPAGSLRGRISVVLRGTCTFETKLNNVQKAGAIAALIYAAESNPDAINMAAGTARLPAVMVSYGDGKALLDRLRAEPGLSLTLDFAKIAFAVDPSRLNGSSSSGPNVDVAIKPDLLAVGTSVLTADVTPTGAPGYTIASGTSLSTPMVSGAAALLKAARPGLSPEQYRSLLVNSATRFGSGLSVQQSGAGLLNLSSALQSTVAAAPASASFGVGGGAVDAKRIFQLTNVGRGTETFLLSVGQIGDGPTASLSSNQVTLDAGQSQEIALQLSASVLEPGQYQGVVLVSGTQSGIESRIPYWYGVPSGVPKHVTVLYAPENGGTGSRQSFFFRVTDASGIALATPADVSVTSGGGTVVSTDSVEQRYPGAFGTLVLLGPEAGPNVFAVSVAGVSAKVTIAGK